VQTTTPCGILSDTAEILFVEDSVYTSGSLVDFCFTEIPYTLEASPSYDYYDWSTGENTPTIEITAEGIYYVTGYADCATFIDTFYVEIVEPVGIVPDLGNDTLICGETWAIELTAPDGFDTYTWSTGEDDEQITVNDAGTYSVTVESTCETYTDEIIISEDPFLNAQINLGGDLILCPPGGINTLIISADTELPNYTWSTGETTMSILITEPGTYWVSSDLLCSTPSDTLRVTLCEDIAVPNAFSPNGDGINDLLSVIVVDPSRIHAFLIYNRWGQLVYDGNSSNYQWDGNFNDEAQPIGTYVFVLTYTEDGIDKTMQGNITLVK